MVCCPSTLLRSFKYSTQSIPGKQETVRKRNLSLPRIKQTYEQRSFMFSAASLWNRLPEELKDCSVYLLRLSKTYLSELKFAHFNGQS